MLLTLGALMGPGEVSTQPARGYVDSRVFSVVQQNQAVAMGGVVSLNTVAVAIPGWSSSKGKHVPQNINNRQRAVPIPLSIPVPHDSPMFRRRSETLFGEGIAEVGMAAESVRSLEAGLVSLLLLTGTLATFGVWFSLPLAYVLTGASLVIGLFGLHWAHQASHALRRNPSLGGRTHARLGAALAFLAVLVSSYANGFLLLMMHPFSWIFWIAVGAVLLVIHFERKSREDAFFEALDDRSGTSTCACCGARISIEDGQWTEDAWVCMTCSPIEGA